MSDKQYTEADVLKARNEGYKSGKDHSESSKETKIFMEETKEQFKKINDRLSTMPTHEGMLLANKELVEEVMNKAEKKFAGKMTERIVYTMVGMILLGVFGRLLDLI